MSRLDIRLHELYPDISRAQLQKFIRGGQVTVNKVVVDVPKIEVSDTDKIKLKTTATKLPEYPKITIEVLYEDDDCVVINKPLGLLTHSKGAYNPEATVATWLADRPNFAFDELTDRSGIVHRLDRATSGVMIAAKNKAALSSLQKQFQTRKAKKSYIARVAGTLKHEHANIDLPIERNPKQPQTFRVGANGKSAQTEYEVIKIIETPKGEDSVIELRPTTGRTHQLRVHMHYLGHPIVGDTLYDGREADRLYLHAKTLEITLPNRERKTFTVEPPKEFLK